jgi:hypothetical protein
MKTVLVLLTCVAMFSCAFQRNVEVEVVDAQLIKIDTIARGEMQEQQLTWKDNLNLEYISYVPIERNYTVGVRMQMLRRR